MEKIMKNLTGWIRAALKRLFLIGAGFSISVFNLSSPSVSVILGNFYSAVKLNLSNLQVVAYSIHALTIKYAL